jgi:hypothetical protein
MRRLVVCCAVFAVASFLGSSAQAAQPRLFLTWHAPFGKPGASDTLVVGAGTEDREDTLYLSFEFPTPTPEIVSMSGLLYFHPRAGDTLGSFWSFKSGQENAGSLLVDFAPFPSPACHSPWPDHGTYGVTYDRTEGPGRLTLNNTMDELTESMGLDPAMPYCYARVRIRHQRPQLGGRLQPVCLDWASAKIRFATGREIVIRGGSERIAGWNSGRNSECGASNAGSRPAPWTPKPKRRGD